MDVTFDFRGARVLVTGGSNGIGHGIATAFGAAGASVTITGTRSAAAEYDHDLSAFTYHQCRMTERTEIDALIAAITADPLDVLVNNAGQNLPGGRSEWDPDVFDETIAVNLTSAFRLSSGCRAALAKSERDGGASVINLASMAALFGMEIVPGYGAAKAGVVQMTKTLAVSWARKGIRVNAIAPGVIESNMTALMLPHEQLTTPLLERTPARRFGTPADIAPVALFLASSGARYITGQTLAVDGGYSVQG